MKGIKQATKPWFNVVQLTQEIDQTVLNQYVADLEVLLNEANANDRINHRYRYRLSSLADYSRLDSDIILVALNDGHAIGLMSAVNEDGKMTVKSIVHPSHRRKGVFRSLLNELKVFVGESKQIQFHLCDQSRSGIACALHLGLTSEPTTDCYMACKNIILHNKLLPNVTFKLGTESDADLVALLYEEDAKWNNESYNYEDAIEDYLNDLKKTRDYRFCYDETNEFVGLIACVSKNDVDPPYIMTFFVRPKYRGKKFGEAILRSVLTYWLEEKKRSAVELETDSYIAYGLYKKCGFEVTQSYNNWYFKK